MTTNHRGRMVRHDPAMAIAPLFRPLRKDGAPRSKLDIRQEFSGAVIRYRGPDALGIGDQTVLLAILYLAQDKGRPLSPDTQGHYTQQALHGLFPCGAGSTTTVYVDTTRYEVLKTAGLGDDGHSYAQVVESIDRLAAVTVFVVDRNGNSPPEQKLLSRIIKEGDEYKIALNERLARAFTGQFVAIDLDERKILRKDTAKALHAWLSGTLRKGCALKISFDKLTFHIYGKTSHNGTLRKWRQRVKEALEKLSGLPSWSVSIENGMACIARAKAKIPDREPSRPLP